MNGFLTQLAQKAAERWLALVVLPGILFAALSGVTWLMDDALHPRSAVIRIDSWFADRPSGGIQMLVVATLVAGAVLSGFAARALAHAVEAFWFTPRLGRLGRALTARRRAHWQERDRAHEIAVIARYQEGPRSHADPEAALAARNSICLVPPARPTWMADRMRAAGERVHLAYGLDLVSLWPRLWLAVPDPVRTELAGARTTLAGDTRLFAWGLLYLIPAVWWWPALLISVLTCTVAAYRAHGSADVLADLVESTVDLHARDVAACLGFTSDDALTPETGEEIKILLRKE
ncbi:hypothetical protein GCM10010260_82410 [Streptomyces filipinensis]|uniref:Vegetative cell wall protein gp1 n=1 Tax=Streptomyces filipinensis TaxID=66887 RepID=A0A918IK99_9ACTN|nr:hypothetical protein [Streptomyces filipinensis]GGV29421.1 hypothetical protein GCM10010260_82410 [Streptomyces filipinensis]